MSQELRRFMTGLEPSNLEGALQDLQPDLRNRKPRHITAKYPFSKTLVPYLKGPKESEGYERILVGAGATLTALIDIIELLKNEQLIRELREYPVARFKWYFDVTLTEVHRQMRVVVTPHLLDTYPVLRAHINRTFHCIDAATWHLEMGKLLMLRTVTHMAESTELPETVEDSEAPEN